MEDSRSTIEIPNAFSMENICHSSNLIKNLLEIIESHPNEIAVNFGRSIIYFIEDDYAKTLNYLELLSSEYPNISLLHRRIAQVLIRENNYQKAIVHLEKVLELDEEDLTAKIWLILSYFKIGNTEKANARLNDLKDFIFVLKATKSTYSGLQS
jgi:tetratricopeptide (TPR) repeat protein